MLTTATTWGITGEQFLWCYGGLCAIAAGMILSDWQRILGPREPAGDEMPDLGLYELAAIADGPELAIASAASQLHRDGAIRTGAGDGLEAVGELDADADPVERAVFETVRDEPGIGGAAMRARVQDSEALRSMIAALTAGGLLVERDATVALARRIALLGTLLALLGLARIAAGAIAGQPVGWLALMVAAIVFGSFWLVARTPVATNRGRAQLARRRDAHDGLRRNATGGEAAPAVMLFPGGR